jgi:aminomethyltransferase
VTDTISDPAHLSPLDDRHRALGARMIEFGGWLMPVQYGGILEEHRAVRERAGLFDLSHMGELFVEGPEAGAALAGALVTNPPTLAVGRAQYSMIVAEDGGIIDDLIVYRLGDQSYLVVANASNAQLVSDTLAERIEGHRAILDDRSLATALIAIQGPLAAGILQPLTDVALEGVRYYGIAEGRVEGIPAAWSRSAWARATRSGSRPGCRSTETSSTAKPRRSTRAWAGW